MLTVPETIEVPSRLIELVVFLEEDEFLGVDEWLRGIEIQPSFEIDGHKLRRVLGGADGAVNQTLLGISAIGDLASAALTRG